MDNINWQQLSRQISLWRAAIHRYPELSHQETVTTEYITGQLSSFLQLQISRPAATGLIVRLKGARPGRTIAFRADIDALPVEEKSGLTCASVRPGLMHACGHDMHSAILMGVASALAPLQSSLAGEVVFIFQRGEEMSPGGAKELVESGALSDIEMFFALHILPALPCGTIALKRGIATSNRDTFSIHIHGRGGHSSMPHLTIDPLIAASAVVQGLQTIIAREISPRESAVISVCSLICGDGTTAAIPNDARLCGTTRTFTPAVREQIKEAMPRIVRGIAQAHRCEARVDFDEWDYSAIVNDEALCSLAEKAARSCGQFHQDDSPAFVGEDFSEYRTLAPICFAWLGAARGEGEQAGLHNSSFNPDERALLHGVRYYLALAQALVM